MPSALAIPDLARLRAEVRAIEAAASGDPERLPFGIAAMDSKLGGGLAVGALHEAAGATSSLNDDAAAALFIAGIAARRGGTVLWVLKHNDLFAPALAQAGLAPDRLIYAECRRDEDVLAVMEEGLRHGSLAAVVGETGRTTMTATRRLQLAAEQSGTTALMLKRWRRNGEDPLAASSAAVTRWRIGCVPSAELAASGIERARWRVELARQRSGPSHQWIMEGTDEAGRLAPPADASNGPAAAGRWEAAARHVA